MNLQEFKSQFYSGSEYIHLNNSGQSLVPAGFRDSAKHWLDRFYTEGGHCSMEGWTQTEVTRKKLAEFLGADPSETAFFQTTASGLSQAAFGIPLGKGDEILTWDQEYPSNFYPWRMAAERSGAQVVIVPSQVSSTPAQALLDRVTKKTKVIAISWVQYQAGAETNLKFISDQLKGTGIWLVADTIQGVGVRPFNFHDSGFDIICGGGHKFLCSAYGTSYMVIKKDRQSALNPLEYGAMTFGTPDTEKSFSNQPRQNSARYEPGSKSMIEIIAMQATLDLFMSFGVKNIYAEATRLADKLTVGLKDLKMNLHSNGGNIVNFSASKPEQFATIEQALTQAKISFAKRGPGIRISPHGFNSDRDIEKVLELVAKSSK